MAFGLLQGSFWRMNWSSTDRTTPMNRRFIPTKSAGGRKMRSSILGIVMLVSLTACNELPAPKVVETEGGVVVEVKRLGEYVSAVARVRLTRTENGECLWGSNPQKVPRPAFGRPSFRLKVGSSSRPTQNTAWKSGWGDLEASSGGIHNPWIAARSSREPSRACGPAPAAT